MPETIRTVPVTSALRRRAARKALFRSYGVMRITPGQRRAILERRGDGAVNGKVNGAPGPA